LPQGKRKASSAVEKVNVADLSMTADYNAR